MQEPRPTLDSDSFPTVLAGARAGEAWAAEVLFTDLQPRLLRFLRSTEPRAADDIAGEVWLAMARGLAAFEGDLAGLRAWVFTVARHRLADHRRTAARRATEPVDHEFFTDRIDGTADADGMAEATGRLSAQDAIDRIVAALPAEQSEVLVLRIVADLDVSQVAQITGRTSNWVRVTQHRALRRLAAVMSLDDQRPSASDATPVSGGAWALQPEEIS